MVFSFAKSFLPNNLERLAHGIIGTLAAFLTTVLFLKLDRKQYSDIGLTIERLTIVAESERRNQNRQLISSFKFSRHKFDRIG